MYSILLDIVVIFALAVAAAIASHRLKIPASVGLLLVGVLAGPHAFGLVRNVRQIEILSEIGVVLLLFVIGLEFSTADLKHLRRQFVVGGSVQFFVTAAIVAAGTLLMNSTPQASLYIGFVVALSSTAIVLRMLQERAELDTPHGRTVLAALIYQDVAVVPVMLMAPVLAGASGTAGVSAILGLIARVAAVGAFAYIAYKWAVPWILGMITETRSSEAFLLGVIGLCIGIAMLTQSVGLSLALGAFLAGFIISESEYSHQAVTVMLPFRDVFVSLFFVSTGMLLNTGYLLANPLRIGLLVLGVIVIKPVVGAAASLTVGLPLRSAVLAGMALGQVGEFSLVATRAAVTAGLLEPDLFQTMLDVAVISMIIAPVLVAVAPRFADAAAATPLKMLERVGYSSTRLGSAHEYSGHVLIVGYGVTGRNLARTARLSDVPYAIIDSNAGTVRDGQEAGEPIHFGDATQELILRHVDADKARAIAVVIDDRAGARRVVELGRRLAPDAFILVRSRYLREVEPLTSLGADEVIADELEVSIEVFSRVLTRMLVPREDIKRLIGEVRGGWRRMSRSLSKDATSVPDLRIDVPDMATHTLRLSERSPLAGVSIAESRLRPDHGVTVLALSREGDVTGSPRSTTVMEPGDVLFVIGPEEWDPLSVS